MTEIESLILKRNKVLEERKAASQHPSKPLSNDERAKHRDNSRTFRRKNPDYMKNYYHNVVRPKNLRQKQRKLLQDVSNEDLISELRRRKLC